MGFFSRRKKSTPQQSSSGAAAAGGGGGGGGGGPVVGDRRRPPVGSAPLPQSNPQRPDIPRQWHSYPEGQQQPPRHHHHHNPVPFQTAGYLAPPPPPGRNHAPPPYGMSPPNVNQYRDPRQYPPIIVNQHYYLGSPPPHSHPHPPPSSLPPPPRPPYANNPYPSSGGGGGGTSNSLSKLKLGSMVDLAQASGNAVHQIIDDGLPRWHNQATRLLNQGAAMYDEIWSKFDDVMTLIDQDKYSGDEQELFVYHPQAGAVSSSLSHSPPLGLEDGTRGFSNKKDKEKKKKKQEKKDKKDISSLPKGQGGVPAATAASALVSGNYFAKVELYANSRLPLDLPPLRLEIATWPLICLAAQYSERVYEKPRGAERDAHVGASWKTGAKAMCIKSVPMDHMNTIVFAIRGTATFMDWAVNLNTAPAAPTGFLDDPTNFCHTGFLSAAREMLSPVASRLRQLLEEDPRRCSHSLLITGHSAGGAVASLIYAHMLSGTVSSELSPLTGCFRRVHCVTFGAPPVSLRPLRKESLMTMMGGGRRIERERERRKWLFLSFVNEGDPVARADKAYVKSLLELFAAPAPVPLPVPGPGSGPSAGGNGIGAKSTSNLLLPPPPPPPPPPPSSSSSSAKHKPRDKKSKSSLVSKASKTSMQSASASSSKPLPPPLPPAGPIWRVPPATLSLAGNRVIVLRSGNLSPGKDNNNNNNNNSSNTAKKQPKNKNKKKTTTTVQDRLEEGVVAQTASDELLRGLVWGDPVCHVMRLYAARVEVLAVGAVTGQGR
ncbi:alpha/beta-hydrolase [Xylariomycetidae sp. FL2044]|nr:alpha/beta-hydrolase [Xylariomycetidae sp. FL2044]